MALRQYSKYGVQSQAQNDTMWEFFSQKTIFVTGGTGFLGSALVLRLVSQARPKCIYLLCRGGKQ